MLLIKLFEQKLRNDLKYELSVIHPELSEDEIHIIINKKITLINLEDKIRSKLPKMIKTDRNNQDGLCCARVWSSHYGNRCSKIKLEEKEYCCQHQDMYEKYGYLSLGRYDEKKPFVNERGNLIPWYDYEILDMLNILTEYIFLKINQIMIIPSII